ncbi:MAG: hypothetical protein R3B72_39910 [Polyangiaceae bacterium]
MRRSLLLALLAVMTAAPAAAGEPPVDATPSPDPDGALVPPSPGHRTLAFGAGILPGVLLHGSGSFALGRHSTAHKLLAAEGVGLGMVAIGLGTLAGTGASRYLAAPAASFMIPGAGLFGMSLVADLLATAWPMEDRGEPLRRAPTVEVELGYRAIHDPVFRYGHLLQQRLTLAVGGLRVIPEMWTAMDDANARMRLEAAYRPFGPRPDREASDGSYVDFRLAATHHRFASDGFRTLTGELAARGRLDLARFDDFLTGQYAELELGVALQGYGYDVPAQSIGADTETILLMRFAHGVYIGDPKRPPYGEIQNYYDHRHDTFAGGLTGFAIGIPGYFGFDGFAYFDDHWGLRGHLEVGSAVLGGVSLLLRSSPFGSP